MKLYLNGEALEVAGTPCLRELVEAHAPPAQPYAVALNASFVPRARHGDTRLQEGDRIEVVVAAQGG